MANDNDTPMKRPPWRALLTFAARCHVPVLALAVLFSVLSGATSPLRSLLIGNLFNELTSYATGAISSSEFLQRETSNTLRILALAAATWAVSSIELSAWLAFGELQAASARNRLFDSMLEKDVSWFEACRDGAEPLLARQQTHIRELQLATAQPLGLLVAMSATAALSLTLALVYSWDLTLVTVSTAPAILGLVAWTGRGMQARIEDHNEQLLRAQGLVTAVVQAIDTVICFNGQEMEFQRYKQCVHAASRKYAHVARVGATQMSLAVLLTISVFVQGFYYGSILVSHGRQTTGRVVTTFVSVLDAFQAVQGILPQLVVLEQGRTAAAVLRSALIRSKNRSKHRRERANRVLPVCEGDIDIRSLSFAYPARPGHFVLRNVSLHIDKGEMVFVVGKSGSGKSTLGQLLPRLYSGEEGRITLDGEPIALANVEWLRSNITLVEQQSRLFDGTVFQNIALGRPDCRLVAHQDVTEAANFAMLSEVMSEMPEGLHTCVGHRGSCMSGGQRQRIALARARLRDTPVLILDESTSALDQSTVSLVTDALREWRRGRTTIVITHNLAQIAAKDRVVVLEDGQLIGDGSRVQLEKSGNETVRSMVFEKDQREIVRQGAQNQAINCFDSTPMFPPNTRHLESPFHTGYRDASREVLAEGQSLKPGASPQRPPDALSDGVKPYVHQSVAQILSTVWPFLDWKFRLRLITGFLAATLHALASPVFACTLAKLIDTYTVVGSDGPKKARLYAAAILAIALTDSALVFLLRYLLEVSGECWVRNVRSRAFQRILDQPKSFFDRDANSVARLGEDLDRNGEEMRGLLGRFAAFAYIAVVLCLASAAWALFAQWQLALLALLLAPYIYTVSTALSATTKRWEALSNDASAASRVVFVEALTGIKTVRALTLERHFRQKHAQTADRCLRTGLKRAFFTGFFYGLAESAQDYSLALLFYAATRLAVAGVPVSSLVEVLTIALIALANVAAIFAFLPQISSAADSGARLLRLAALPTNHARPGPLLDEAVSAAAVAAAAVSGDVVFRNLTFSYPGRRSGAQPVLRSLNLRVPHGRIVAVTGASGAGKSTLASLLLGLRPPPYADAVALAGVPLGALDAAALRAHVGFVPQQPAVFAATVAANIAYPQRGTTAAQMRRIVAAAALAGLHEFVTSLPDGYATVLAASNSGGHGLGLSGGQMQRIGLARALARRPALLVLDEATAGLDAAAVRGVAAMLRGLRSRAGAGVTVVAITHDVRMMASADKVVVLAGGQVVEEGSFEDLVGKREGKLRALLRGAAEVTGE